MARAAQVAPSTVHKVWRAFGLQPHRTETFKLSTDPQFIEKVRDIVGLYLNPPERAMVLCVDEKTQVQALDRTQPLLPLRPGQAERRTHDYKRHGTTSLFAALDVAMGNVIGRCFQRHRAAEFRKFLDLIEASVPADYAMYYTLRRSMARLLRAKGASMEDIGGWLGHRIPNGDVTEVFYAPADPNYPISARVAQEKALDEIAAHIKVAPLRPTGDECSQIALKAGRGRAMFSKRQEAANA